MRLKTFLFELSVVQGNDIDFIDNSNYVILFSKDDNYSLEGKTHGLLSHSIKHLREFNPSLVKTLLHKTISILLKYKNSLFFYKKGTGFITSGYPKITDSIVLTTLDAIQDKIQLKKSLSPIEKEISNEVLNQFEMEYKKIVDQIMANGVDITNLSVEDIIKVFGQNKKYAIIVCGNGDSMYIDINSGWALILNKNKAFSTSYTVDNNNRGMYFKIASRNPKNPKVLDALKIVLNIK